MIHVGGPSVDGKNRKPDDAVSLQSTVRIEMMVFDVVSMWAQRPL